MSQLVQIFSFVATTLQSFLNTMMSNWLSSTILYLVVLDIVVSVILIVRGTK